MLLRGLRHEALRYTSTRPEEDMLVLGLKIFAVRKLKEMSDAKRPNAPANVCVCVCV